MRRCSRTAFPQYPVAARCCGFAAPLLYWAAGAPAGAEFAYNNADYLVLGRVVERLTRQSYEAALETRLLRPLGLSDTGMMHWDRILPHLASTYFWREDQKRLIA